MGRRTLTMEYVVTMTILFPSSFVVAVNLTYECYPNATLKVENPADFTMVFANNSHSICTTTWTPGKTAVYIDDCEMEDDIFIVFSYLKYPYMKLIGGQTFELFSINCVQLPINGDFKQVSSVFGAKPSVLEKFAYPIYTLDSGIYKDPSGLILETKAHVGTPLFWIMRSPQTKYRFRPVDCWAYAGKGINETAPKKKILENGCTVDQKLMTNFLLSISSHGGQEIFIRRAVLYAFRFYISEYITMLCKVRVCDYDTTKMITFCDEDESSAAFSANQSSKACSSYGGINGRDIRYDESEEKEFSYAVETFRVEAFFSNGTSIEAECAWFLLVWLILKLF